MKIIAGLGNPGLLYKRTRHNAGFMVIEALAKKHGLRLGKKGFDGRYGVGRFSGQEVMLFEPLTYMNLSGEAIKGAVASRLDDISDLLVVVDDLNLPLGSIRIRPGGSDGGHNGLKSIAAKIGTGFTRLRIGIGSGDIPGDTARFVLSPFSREEKGALEGGILDASACAEIWLKEGVKEAMNKFN
jgi:PTH1 family peptidyl-tRNA hydrolase